MVVSGEVASIIKTSRFAGKFALTPTDKQPSVDEVSLCITPTLHRSEQLCLKAKMWEISNDIHQSHYIPKHHFII